MWCTEEKDQFKGVSTKRPIDSIENAIAIANAKRNLRMNHFELSKVAAAHLFLINKVDFSQFRTHLFHELQCNECWKNNALHHYCHNTSMENNVVNARPIISPIYQFILYICVLCVCVCVMFVRGASRARCARHAKHFILIGFR